MAGVLQKYLSVENLPMHVQTVIRSFSKTAMRPILVGGCVRDALLGRKSKEYDVEVFGCDCVDTLMEHLQKTCSNVSYVGQSFGVFKVGVELELSLPRKDSKVGTKHTDFSIEFLEKDVSYERASVRRDLTVNSMGYDPVQDELYDPHQGCADLAQKRLRCVDKDSFCEDPLRPWRVLQFAARLDMTPDQVLCDLSRDMPLDIAPERVYAEIKKWFQSGNNLRRGWDFFVEADLGRYLQEQGMYWRQKHTQKTIREALGVLQGCNLGNSAMMTLGVMVLILPCPQPAGVLSFLCAPIVMRDRIRSLRKIWSLWSNVPALNYPFVCALLRAQRLGVEHDAMEAFGRMMSVNDKESRDAWGGVMAQWAKTHTDLQPLVRGVDICSLGVPSGPVVGRLVRLCHKMQVEEQLYEKADLLQRVQKLLGRIHD